LGELLEILNSEDADINCECIFDYDIFSTCCYQWTFTSGKSRIVKQLKLDISESCQKVDADNFWNKLGFSYFYKKII
jgi:hypothetical protein